MCLKRGLFKGPLAKKGYRVSHCVKFGPFGKKNGLIVVLRTVLDISEVFHTFVGDAPGKRVLSRHQRIGVALTVSQGLGTPKQYFGVHLGGFSTKNEQGFLQKRGLGFKAVFFPPFLGGLPQAACGTTRDAEIGVEIAPKPSFGGRSAGYSDSTRRQTFLAGHIVWPPSSGEMGGFLPFTLGQKLPFTSVGI